MCCSARTPHLASACRWSKSSWNSQAWGQAGSLAGLAAARLDLGPAGAGVDVAVLDLGEDRPGWLPAPVPVWPAARPPGRVQVFGYPLAEGPLNGVWRQFAVAGPASRRGGAAGLDR